MLSGRMKLVGALVIAAVAGGATLLGWSEPFAFHFGEAAKLERIYSVGFYPAEQTPSGVGGAWSSDAALLRLPWSEVGGASRLVVTMAAPRNPGQPPPTVYLNLDGQPLAKFAPDANLKDYSIALPARDLRLDDSYLYINSETFTPKGDSRSLGVFISAVRLEGISLPFALARAALVALIALAVYGLVRRLNGRWWLGVVAELVVGLGIALGLALARTQVAPYLTGWLVIAGGSWLAFRAADGLSAKLGGGPLVPLTYAALLYPVAAVVQVAWDRVNFSDLLNGRAATIPQGVLLYAAIIGGVALLAAYVVWRDDAARLRRVTLVIFLAVAVAYYLASHAYVFSHNLYGGIDLKQDYDALVNWRAGGSPYSLDDALLRPGTAVKLPPLFGYFLLPQIALGWSFEQTLLWWRIGNELLYALAFYITLRAFGVRLFSAAGGAALWLALMSGQVAETLAWGQFNVIILLGIAVALWLVRQGRPFAAGLALALPVMLKFFPATMALPWVMQRRVWRGWGGLAVGFGALALLPIPLLGWDTFSFYWTQIFPSIGGGADEGVSNQSVYAMIGRLAVSEVNLEHRPAGAWWVTPLAYAVIALLIGTSAWLVWRWQGGNRTGTQDKWALFPYLLALALGLLIIPFAWMHYETVLLPCFVGLLLWLGRDPGGATGRDKSRPYDVHRPNVGAQFIAPSRVAPLFGIAFALIGYGGRYEFVGNYAVGLDRVGASYHGLAVLLLWLLLARIVWQKGDRHEPEETKHATADAVGSPVAD